MKIEGSQRMSRLCVNNGIVIAMFLLLLNWVFAEPQLEHTYLYFSETNIEKLKERIKQDKAMENAWSSILENAQKIVTKDAGHFCNME